MTVSEQQQIEDFIDKKCQADERGDFLFNLEGLICLLEDFEKQSLLKSAHEREQRRFIAANSAMNGLLANPQTQTVGSYATGSEIANLAVSYATCLLAELETTKTVEQ